MTKADFIIELQKYAQIDGHIPSLVKRLNTEGYSKLNALMLEKALSKLPSEIEKEVIVSKIGQIIDSDEFSKLNEGDALAIEMRRLIGEKNKIANTFFDNQNNPKKCKVISVQVLTYEAAIEGMREKLTFWNQYGKMPDAPKIAKAEDNLPDTKYELSKKIESLRVMIKQVEAELEKAVIGGDVAKVNSREKRLLDLKHLRDLAQKKMKEALV